MSQEGLSFSGLAWTFKIVTK